MSEWMGYEKIASLAGVMQQTEGLLVMVGVPYSGKTTFVKNVFPGVKAISLDDCREMLTDDVGNQACTPAAVGLAKTILDARSKLSKFSILDATNVVPEHVQSFFEIVKANRPEAKLYTIFMNQTDGFLAEARAERKREVPVRACEMIASRLKENRRSLIDMSDIAFDVRVVNFWISRQYEMLKIK